MSELICRDRLARYKVPMRFTVVARDSHHGERFKKRRTPDEAAG